ncbi:MAG TPA: Ni/Fe hydrogenase subunit alpha [Phycisphaerae bacterium]|nr:Ni/Fe hydrogenase subunit alpha [Phycisphaerae bacterium]
MKNVTIDVKRVTRVEGHGNIHVDLREGRIAKLELAIVESPRFFESFLRGRHWSEVPRITCRICGICSVGHTSAAVKAVESALGIVPSEQTVRLRKLMLYGEMIQSHVLHLYFLAAPDFLGVGSVIPLAKTHPEVVQRALRMKRLANDICAVVGGRHIHPIAIQVGGVSHLPEPGELGELRARLAAAREDLHQTVTLFSSLEVPDWHRPTEYVSLKDPTEYAFYGGDIVSTLDPRPTIPADYRKRVLEEVVEHSAAKHCHSPNSSTYAVGALARFNNNHTQLHESARAVAALLGLKAPCSNPFHNNTAQLVETVHCVEEAIRLIDDMAARPLVREQPDTPRSFGRGVGAVEVPRGVLFHEYEFDANGRVASANLIIPTGQNLANIEKDMHGLTEHLLAGPVNKEDLTLKLEMLVRAYDPCISCATHFLNVTWK